MAERRTGPPDALRVLSLGAGVQSTVALLLAIEGQYRLDAAVFADTGWERATTYEHLARLSQHAVAHGIPVHRVTASVGPINGFPGLRDMPWFLRTDTGVEGMSRRQCTGKQKVQPVRRLLRQMMREAGHRHVLQSFGISSDEVQRMRDSDVRYVTHAYPLVDLRMNRHDCSRYLAARGWSVPRSSCIGCPYHSDAEWRALTPGEFDDAVRFERACQDGLTGLRGTPYLHRARVPLDQVDLTTREDHGQMQIDGFGNDCDGMCGT